MRRVMLLVPPNLRDEVPELLFKVRTVLAEGTTLVGSDHWRAGSMNRAMEAVHDKDFYSREYLFGGFVYIAGQSYDDCVEGHMRALAWAAARPVFSYDLNTGKIEARFKEDKHG